MSDLARICWRPIYPNAPLGFSSYGNPMPAETAREQVKLLNKEYDGTLTHWVEPVEEKEES